ncbi:IucA/IucC family protein [Deinococcus cellulosilyticus]|uniref:Uncharacterized protein n=1 Tax=Deinococcus cellulosilyticus (strain DSM 18568 / NBRC 106333 / KACC 11606 / 5516J-15) TaxID=1223518 RepID=A0A511MVS7_DEIC1|nr:IucA/IucC family protein [Deinococcus cellulosilyticus]GEM44674.1 hypothetical protein DC3_03090 [Deinococcus cellulosilyticus NBRC 106333 = KACC 11606]
MAHRLTPSRADFIGATGQEEVSRKLLTALLRENIGGLDQTPMQHPSLGLCVQHGPHLIPVRPEGLWHPLEARSAEVWNEDIRNWISALDFAGTLDLPGFDLLKEEFEAAQQYSQYRLSQMPQLLAKQTTEQNLLFFDRLAALLDHPIYPLPARLGFGPQDLQMYCPESSKGFLLRWVAVPAQHVFLSSKPPEIFPDFADVGLPDLPEHHLLPVHPHSLDHVESLTPDLQLKVAPLSFLKVHPTLSLRTVVLEDAPELHLKLPLRIRTLGYRNLRTLQPKCFKDGAVMQEVLRELCGPEVLLTDESHYGHAGTQDLGYLLRKYPALPKGSLQVGLASLLAPHPDGGRVIEHLTSSPRMLLRNTVQLLLETHLKLALRHGIVLEAHQQNTTLVLKPDGLHLLLRDNDAPRIHWEHFRSKHPDLAQKLLPFGDPCLPTDSVDALADMFITIILHLCVTSVLRQAAEAGLIDLHTELQGVRHCIERLLDEHQDSPFAGHFRKRLLEDVHFPSKTMLSAGTLFPKADLGVSDINKSYRRQAPNYLRTP